MTKIFFVYRYRTDRKGNRYTPSHEFGNSYPEWEWKATIVDEKISTNIPLWKRLGWVECDDEMGLTVQDELINFWKYGWLIYITPAEAIQYMKAYTDYPEVTPWVFEIAPAIEELWFESPQVLLDIN